MTVNPNVYDEDAPLSSMENAAIEIARFLEDNDFIAVKDEKVLDFFSKT